MKTFKFAFSFMLAMTFLLTGLQAQTEVVDTKTTTTSTDSKACCDGVLGAICKKLCPPGCCAGKSSAQQKNTSQVNLAVNDSAAKCCTTPVSSNCCSKSNKASTKTANTGKATAVTVSNTAKKPCCKSKSSCSKVKG